MTQSGPGIFREPHEIFRESHEIFRQNIGIFRESHEIFIGACQDQGDSARLPLASISAQQQLTS